MPRRSQKTHSSSWAVLNNLPPVIWDWPGWLPRNFLTVLASEPGAGKSTLCLHLAAIYLNNTPWPDGAPFNIGPGHIIWCESEASHALNLERARRWNLDLARILTPLDHPFHNFKLDKKEHTLALLALGRRPDVRLIILDSLRGLRSYGRDAYTLHECLLNLAEIARLVNAPVILTHHLRKRITGDPSDLITTDRLLGASAISQTARMIWAIDTPDPTTPDHRRLSVIKNNLGPFPSPLGFTISDEGPHFGPAPVPPTPYSELDRALDFLRDLLADNPLPVNQIFAAAQEAGFSQPTLRRAKKHLFITSFRQTDQDSNQTKWYWSLPGKK